MLEAVEAKLSQLDFPTGEAARQFLHVLLGIVAFAETKQLHQLAGVVLVRMGFAIGRRIEINEHRRIAGNLLDQRPKIAQRVSAEQPILLEHQVRVGHFIGARGKVPVPEQRHSLEQRIVRGEHDVHPPGGELPGVARRQNGRRQFIALLANVAGVVRAAHDLLDDGCRDFASPPRRFAPRGAECGAAEQMSRQRPIPFVPGGRLEGLPGPCRIDRIRCQRHRSSPNPSLDLGCHWLASADSSRQEHWRSQWHSEIRNRLSRSVSSPNRATLATRLASCPGKTPGDRTSRPVPTIRRCLFPPLPWCDLP